MTVRTSGSDAVAFAGRTAELAILNAAADAAKAGRFSAVLISGEPGIGKTRLTEEACSYATAEGFEVAAGRCFDTQSGLTYFPFIQAFGQLAKRPSPQTAAGTRRSGAKGVGGAADIIARLAIPATGSARLTPEISSAAQTELFDSVVCFLRARSEICPVLVVLEDLDWADEDSLSLLLHLVRMLATARVLIIGTCRANDTNQGLELGRALAECGRNRCYKRIRLKGLSETDAANLAERLLGLELAGEAQGVTADISRLTNGNPLFIHQIVHHLMEVDRLRKRGGQSVFSSGWESKLAADDAIRDLVDGRLSGLSERCREVLSQAAVLGEEFEFEVLARMLRCGEEELADLMEEASGAGLIAEAGSDQTTDFAFVHALVRQSLYERQSRPFKRVAHADAAQAIETVHRADLDLHLSQLALHYARAGRAGNLAKAAEYSMRAGETASAVCAYADAVSHWRAALKLASADDQRLRAQLMERLGDASLLSAATPAEAAHHLQAALKLYAELGQEADAARVHARLVTVMSVRLVTVMSVLSMNPAPIDAGRAVSHSRRAEKLLATRSDPSAEGELLMGEALVAHAQFRTEDGLAASERAMKIGQSLDNTGIWCEAAAWHGHFLWASGKLKEGIALMEQAVERAERTRHLRPRFVATWLLSFSYLLLWDPGGAERTIEAALADSVAGQVEFLRQVLVAHLGIANIFTGALTRARSFLTMAPHRFLEANLRVFEGEWTQAEDLLSQQIERSHVGQSKQQHWTASLWLARLKRVQGDDTRALELLTSTPLVAESLLRIPEEITPVPSWRWCAWRGEKSRRPVPRFAAAALS
jgi:tetratricopeptide (TPR) repeat protein